MKMKKIFVIVMKNNMLENMTEQQTHREKMIEGVMNKIKTG